jgi:hypothetical protein
LWDQDLGELEVSLIALDDTGNRFGVALQDEFAEWEREEIAKRTQDGLLEKCRGGLVIKRKRAAYGFRASEDGNALEVSEPEMEVVRRIFRSVAEGLSVRSVRISLERDGIPAPSGIGRWNHTTIRNIIVSELYVPHTYDEVAVLVEPGVAARLDKGAAYGLWTWNTRKTTRRKVWDETTGEFKIRYNYAPPRRMALRAGARRRRVARGCGRGEAEPQGQRTQAVEGRQTLLGALGRHPALRGVRAHPETQHRPQEERRAVSLLLLPLPPQHRAEPGLLQ